VTALDDRPTFETTAPTTGLGLLMAALAEKEAADPRALQIQTGASQAMGCRAESLWRLLGIPESDPRLRLDAWIGKAAHAAAERALKGRPGLLVEHRAVYRGVPCTIDLGNITANLLSDWKFPRLSKIVWMQKYGIGSGYRGQLHMGAAALRAEGHQIDRVSLVCLPRDGEFDDAWEYSEPFSQEIADEAADRVAQENARAAEMAGILDRFEMHTVDARTAEIRHAIDMWDLRDEDHFFCRQFCSRVTDCRGPEGKYPTADDPVLIEAAQQYAAATWQKREAEALLEEWRPHLEGVKRIALDDGTKIAWSGGNPKVDEVEDLDRVRREYELVCGPIPTKQVTKTTAVSLRVTFPKKPAGVGDV